MLNPMTTPGELRERFRVASTVDSSSNSRLPAAPRPALKMCVAWSTRCSAAASPAPVRLRPPHYVCCSHFPAHIDALLRVFRCANKRFRQRRTATATSRATTVRLSRFRSTVKAARNKCGMALVRESLSVLLLTPLPLQYQQDEHDSYENDEQDEDDVDPSSRGSG